MRKSMVLLLLIPMTALSGLGCAVDSGARPPAQAVNAEHEVRAVIDQFYKAAKERDWDTVSDMLTADFEIYTDGASSFSKKDYVDVLKADDLELEEMELRDVDLHVSEGGRMAWSKFRGLFKHGYSVETVETLIFRNEGDGWKISHAHASVKMLDEPATGSTGEGS